MSQGCALLILRSKGQGHGAWLFENGFWTITDSVINLWSWNFIHLLTMSQGCALLILRSKGQVHGAWLFENGFRTITDSVINLWSWNFIHLLPMNLLGSVGDLYCFSNTFSMLLYVAPICCPSCFLYNLTKGMLLLIHWKSFEFSTWLTREMFIWLKNSTLGISNSEDFHYLHWRLIADYPGHVTTYFRTQCQRPVHPKDLIYDIWHSVKINYPYTKPQSRTPFNSNYHPSKFCTKLWSETFSVESENAVQIALDCFVLTLRAVYGYAWIFFLIWKLPGWRYLYFWSDFIIFR